MRNSDCLNLENRIWQQAAAAGVLTGLAAGLIGTVFPQAVFYETARYYSGEIFPADGVQMMEWIKNIHYFEYFVQFLCIRILIPCLILTVGIFRKSSFFLWSCLVMELMAAAFWAVMVFGAGGMKGILFYLRLNELPESCNLLAVILAFYKKKRGIYLAKQYMLTIIETILLLCSGAAAEIWLFQWT